MKATGALPWVRMPTAKITSKGQITIPLEVRQRLDVKPGDRIEFQFGPAGDVRLTSKRIPFEQIQGMLRRPKHKVVTIREMDRSIEREFRARWKRSSRPVK
jgi:antitoxin PrlF